MPYSSSYQLPLKNTERWVRKSIVLNSLNYGKLPGTSSGTLCPESSQKGSWVGKENCRSLGFARDDKGGAVLTSAAATKNCRSLGFARDDKGGSSAHLSGCYQEL